MNKTKIVFVSTTHWDREWYLPFEEFRSRLVHMMDKLLYILENNDDFKNFTLDGQTIPLADYLEVRPEKELEIKKYIKEGRLSIGPMYVLPDEFLVSGESIIRNLLIGITFAKKFGKYMNAGYIPDSFGHIAQIPQILSGFEIPSVFFARGFGNEFSESNLNFEFNWRAPGNAASVIGIHLILGYGSIADLDTRIKNGEYKYALRKIKRVVSKLGKYIATPFILLNNGTDHSEADPEIPAVIKQWNEINPDQRIEQCDFEYYITQIIPYKDALQEFQGELRGGRYAYLLSGILSARMWIKQRNTEIEYLYEKYTEPMAAITWVLDKFERYMYPKEYINRGLTWLLQNHPHDSICGCSIDQVHNEMKTRFDWAHQIALEIYKQSFLYLSNLIQLNTRDKDSTSLIIFNPLPWKRKDTAFFDIILNSEQAKNKDYERIKILDYNGQEIEYQAIEIDELPRYKQEKNVTYRLYFLADMPSCGYKVFRVLSNQDRLNTPVQDKRAGDFRLDDTTIENEFYKVKVNDSGQIDVIDKKSGKSFQNICQLEDAGDWGDEYDFSWPHTIEYDKKYYTSDASIIKILPHINGPTQKTLRVLIGLDLPISLTEDRAKRDERLVINEINIYITLYKGINKIDFKIELYNNSKDHRIRVLFPSYINADRVFADGHFYIVPRTLELPDAKNWVQKPLSMNHQKDFVCVSNQATCYAVLNKGLPEYEAIKTENGITLAITLLRCIEWLSRADLATRGSNAGPDLYTPEAQCLGYHSFDLSLVIAENKSDLLESNIHVLGKEFNAPLKTILPDMTKTPMLFLDKLLLTSMELLEFYKESDIHALKPYLPLELSFLEIENKKIMLSILKKAENDNDLILRCYNVSSTPQNTKITVCSQIFIQSVKIVNLLEEPPNNPIKAVVELIDQHSFELKLESHVITTLKIETKKGS